MDHFTTAYNHEHHHTGTGLHTPPTSTTATPTPSTRSAQQPLDAARQAHPERFATNTHPKILALPDNAWINQPAETAAA